MAYVSVSEWRPEQVTEWLKGLDVCVTPYLHWFSNNEVNGQLLLNLSPDELTLLGVDKIGHQELILDAVEHLRNFHYELDRENLQLLALRVSCAAHSLYNEIKHKGETTSVPTQVMADVSNVISHVKPLVLWLDRPPFSGQIEYTEYKTQLLRISLEMATCAQRDTFAERPISEIRNCSSKLAKLADSIIQDIKDPMLLQPASLDLATIKKRVGEDLGFFLIPSFHGIHQISDMKLSSPAHQSGKIQPGDEVVQVNYQTVVGWSRKKVLALFEESPNDLLLTLKRRPRHVKMYGQIYMKPYRLPSRKRASPYSRWNDNVPSPRPELIFQLDIPRVLNTAEKVKKNEDILSEPSGTSSSSDEEFGHASDSQNSVSLRHYFPKPRAPIQRRFTLSGPPRPSAQSEQFWRELQLERSWRSSQNNSQINNSNSEKLNKDEGNVDMFQLRDKSASLGNSIATPPARPSTCITFTKTKMGSVKFDLPKLELASSNNPVSNDKVIAQERDKTRCDKDSISSSSAVEKDSENGAVVKNDSTSMGSNCKMTISELNKIKRDAFFSNMDCSRGMVQKPFVEDSSEKVKRIIENFKFEVSNIKMEITEPDIITMPGKVSQLIGNFERKELENSKSKQNDKEELNFSSGNVKIKERFSPEGNRVSDSHQTNRGKTSTAGERLSHNPEIIHLRKSLSSLNINQEFEIRNHELEKETHGQMVNTINDYLLPDRDFYGTDYKNEETAHFDEDDDISNGSDYEYGVHNKAREIVDTVSLALVELKQRQDHYDLRDKQKDGRSEFIKEMSSSSSTSSIDKTSEATQKPKEDLEIMKPIPRQRKSKMQSDGGASVNTLPPKPRPRMMDKPPEVTVKPPVKSRTPPEPPPRPESTFSKVFLPRKNESDKSPTVSEIRKGTIAISPPLTITSGTPVNLPMTTVEMSNKSYDARQVPSPNSPIRESSKTIQSSRNPSSVLNFISEKPKSSGGTLESLKAMLSLGRKPLSFNSPRSVRKKNAMLARKRNVSVKEVTPGENSGILWHRNRKGTSAAPWSKFFFVLQSGNFYGFKGKDSQKADLFIHLPGFTCTIAEEVKSKEFAFKIYHTGTAFYFAANSKEDLQQWIDCISPATICPDDKQIPESVTFSVSDSDSSDYELEPETCFPTSPKMKKFLGSSPVPKPARSHQNLASDSKKTYDIQKRFGSLKKLSSQKNSSAHQVVTGNDIGNNNNNAEVASLDRKYLRFLGHKSNPLPVPTSQFRSYRRMQPSASAVQVGRLNVTNENCIRNTQQSCRDQPGLVRKTLHLSNPSLIHPDMADYRITQERLAEFRRLRNQENNQDNSGFMTLEQFMTSRQEEEAALRSNRSRPPELRGFMTLEQFLLLQEEERQLANRSNRLREKPEALNEEPNIGHEEEKRRSNLAKITRSYPRGEASSISKEYPQVKPRTTGTNIHNVLKPKGSWKSEPSSCSSSKDSTGEFSYLSCRTSASLSSRRNHSSNQSSEEEESSGLPECPHLSKDPTPDYPGIEYPPAFEPETYTLQYMLKNRRKKSSNRNDKGDR